MQIFIRWNQRFGITFQQHWHRTNRFDVMTKTINMKVNENEITIFDVLWEVMKWKCVGNYVRQRLRRQKNRHFVKDMSIISFFRLYVFILNYRSKSLSTCVDVVVLRRVFVSSCIFVCTVAYFARTSQTHTDRQTHTDKCTRCMLSIF